MNNSTTTDTSRPVASQEEIAARARQIWLARGQPIGQDVEIWLQAERELNGPYSAPATSNSPAASATTSSVPGRSQELDTQPVVPAGRGVAKKRSGKSLPEKVDEALADRGGGYGEGGHAKIIKQTT